MVAKQPGIRDFADYERAYRENDFEAVQARQRKRMLLQLLEQLRPQHVLEVGCGLDTLANHWTASERFVIVEPAERFAAQARSDTISAPGVEVLEGTLEDVVVRLLTDCGDAPFDLILLSGLLNELVDCEPIMKITHALCGPNTVVHVNVANAHSIHRLLAMEMGLIDSVMTLSPQQMSLQQHRIFTMSSMIDFVSQSGFKVVDSGSYFIKPFSHAQMKALQDIGFLTDVMIDGLWNLEKYMPGLGSELYVNIQAV